MIYRQINVEHLVNSREFYCLGLVDLLNSRQLPSLILLHWQRCLAIDSSNSIRSCDRGA